MMQFKSKLFYALLFYGSLCTKSASAINETAVQNRSRRLSPSVAFPTQTFYLPLPEESMFKDMFYQINPKMARPGIVTMLSLAISTDNTVIWYDHWEDGYEEDVTTSISAETHVWGDGDASNGCAPNVEICIDESDVLNAGDTIVIQNTIPLPRDQSQIFFDGGDRIQASFPVVVTRGSYPVEPGSLMAGAVEVVDTNSWGFSYEAPLGMDIGEYFQAFQYSAFFIMAGEDDTELTLPDGTKTILQQGEGATVPVNLGDKVNASKKIQVDLITGDVWSYYELRWYSLMPTENWAKKYVSSVGDTHGRTKVLLYNPNSENIDVSIDYLENGTEWKTVTTSISAGRASMSHVIPTGSGAWFNSTKSFLALSLTDTEFTTSTGQKTGSQWYDWGFPVIPRNSLSSQVIVGWGYGCTDNKCYGQADRSVVWITSVKDADIFIDYNNIGGDYVLLQTRALESHKITDSGDNDMSGAVIFATERDTGMNGPSVDIAAAWGQDPAISEEYQSISLDLGTVVLPFAVVRVTKNVDKTTVLPGGTLTYTIRINNVGSQDVQANAMVVFDDLDKHTTYIHGSSSYGKNNEVVTTTDDTTGTTLFPLDESGQIVPVGIERRGGSFDFSFQVTVDDYVDLRSATIKNVGRATKPGGGYIEFEAISTVDFQAQVAITNEVYLGHDGGQACSTSKPEEKVQGDFGDDVTFCFKVTNTGPTKLGNVLVFNPILEYSALPLASLAPGESSMFYVDGTIKESIVNTATVTANPVYFNGDDIEGLRDVQASDPSEVEKVQYSAQISVENTVYLGSDNGGQCDSSKPTELAEGFLGDDVVYCFVVTNSGDSYLNNVVFDNPSLSFSDATSFGQLAPGQSVSIFYQTKLTGSLQNTADVSANPVTADGTDITELDNVVDSDPSEVVAKSGTAQITIENEVYRGEDSGASCTSDAVEKVEGYAESSVVYCFTITNNGETHLGNIVLEDPKLDYSDSVSIGSLAPGETKILSHTTTIAENMVNFATVTANPVSADGSDLVGHNDVTDNDPSEVVLLSYDASVSIENTVYLGYDGGKECRSGTSVERVTGYNGADVTYCFLLANTGSTVISNVVLSNNELGFSYDKIPALNPGAKFMIYYQSAISGDMINNAVISGMPSSTDGTPLPGASTVTSSDPSEVGRLAHQPSILVTNTVYVGDDNGAQCATDKPTEVVEGYSGENVIYCMKIANTGNTYLTNFKVLNQELSFSDSSSYGMPPGTAAMIKVARTITETMDNTVTVTATPVSSTGQKIDGVEDVTSSDPSGVKLMEHASSVAIDNTVYLDHDSGASCKSGIQTSDSVEAYGGSKVTYCFKVVNTGKTYLKDIVIEDDELSFIDRSIDMLAPGDAAYISLPHTMTNSLINIASVVATPASADGLELPGLDSVDDSDTSQVVAKSIQPEITIDNRVFLSDTSGASCNTASNRVEGHQADSVSYCFKVVNTGDTYLENVIVTVDALDYTDSSIGALAPGDTATVVFPTSIKTSLANEAKATGTPATAQGVPVAGADDVQDEDSSEVVKLEHKTGIEITNTVYAGHNSGAFCNSTSELKESVEGFSGTTVTYCLEITNTGETYLGNISLSDAELKYSMDDQVVGLLAPGASATFPVAKLISASLTNSAVVVANPVDETGRDLVGVEDVTDTDTSAVTIVAHQPSIAVDNTVYLGSDAGASCGTSKAVEKAIGYSGDYVTYCFEVTNTGDTFLGSVTVHDEKLSFTDLSVGTLAPGQKALVIFATVIENDLENTVEVRGNPVNEAIEDILGADDVTATDPSEVDTIPATPAITVTNKVYLGTDNGDSCGTDEPVESVEGYRGESVVYCFTIINTGDTHLDKVALNNTELSQVELVGLLAPGEKVTVPFMTYVNETLKNNANVAGTPVTPSGITITGVGDVKSTDPSEVEALKRNTGIVIENTVYVGHNSGESCGTEKVKKMASGFNGIDVTYCFKVTNTGETHLGSLSIDDTALSYQHSNSNILAPGESYTVFFDSAINDDLTNIAKVTANPVDASGVDLPMTDDVSHSDPSEVNKLSHEASVKIHNTVYSGHDSGESCGTVNAIEKLEGYKSDDITYCLTIINTGNTHLNRVKVVDSDLSFGDTTSAGLLAPGDAVTLTVPRVLTESLLNAAVVTAKPVSETGEEIEGAYDVTDSDPSQVVVIDVNPTIRIDNVVYLGQDEGASCGTDLVSENASGYSGANVVYCFTITNTGNTHLNDVVINNVELGVYDDSSIDTLAPGQNVTVPVSSTITSTLRNTAIVTATPITPEGEDIQGVGVISSTDPSEVEQLGRNASIRIENTVYLRHNGGYMCSENRDEKVMGLERDDVTYCFKVTNTGETYLNKITIDNVQLSLSADQTMNMLPPGASAIIHLPRTITGRLVNTVSVVATPVSKQGEVYADTDKVTDSDPSEVDILTPASSIEIQNKVYSGDDGGVSCDRAVEQVTGHNIGDNVTYCFAITNTGNTYLGGVVIDNEELDFADSTSIDILPPGATATISIVRTVIPGTQVNSAIVTANPVTSSGKDAPGVPDVTDTDPSTVVSEHLGPIITIENTVYQGDDYGASCSSADEVAHGRMNDTAVYCFKLTNTGDTHLTKIIIRNPALQMVDNSVGKLAPGQSELVVFFAPITSDLTNNATVTANPVDENGNDLDEYGDVTDTDPSQVKVGARDTDTRTWEKIPYKPPSPPGQCMQDNYGSELVCAAKEVYLETVSTDVQRCVKGEEIIVTVDASMRIASSRRDLGWYVANDGGNSLEGTCVTNGLQESNADKVVESPGSPREVGTVSWLNDVKGGSDSCGDISIEDGGSGNLDIPILVDTPIICTDENEDGDLDFSICFTWRTDATDSSCSVDTPTSVIPGEFDACYCTRYDLPEITVVTPTDEGVEPCR